MAAEKNYDEGDVIEVRWADCEDNPSWTPLEIVKLEKVPICKTVGYFINEDEDCIRLAFSVTEDTEVARVIIPRGMVKSVRKIEENELDDFE